MTNFQYSVQYNFLFSTSISLFSSFSKYSNTFCKAFLSVALKNAPEVIQAISCKASQFKGGI
jgi:hypothetical protein